MNLSWRQLLLCGAAAGLLGYVGYRAVLATLSERVEEAERQESAVNGKKKRKAKTSKKSSVSSSRKAPATLVKDASEPEIPEELAGVQDMLAECDLPVPDLLKLSAEKKQRVFYALLMKGEMLLGRGPKELEKALEYFSKAVSLVPNPGEVVAAFEKTLPPAVFNALLDHIQRDIQVKVSEYFAALMPTNGSVGFAEVSGTEPGSDRIVKSWVPVTTREVTVGTTLWTETADVTSLTAQVVQPEDHCEHCLKKLSDDQTRHECPACNVKLYCSDQCRIKSADIYHCYFCQPPAEVENALDELRAACQETGNSLALLVLRYVAFLLSEELKGNGGANNGPFAHYDHLKPVFRAPTDFDRREAQLLRAIFAKTNRNIVDFLSDEIYTSMKATMARNVTAIPFLEKKDQSEAGLERTPLSRLETRQLEGSTSTSASALSFFHTAAHLAHACDPNAVIVCKEARFARVAALKNIGKGDQLTVSYLPFPTGTTATERQLHLMRIFSLACTCNLCEADLPSP